MNCVNCGNPLRPGAMFCPQCGTQQPEQQPEQQPDSQPAQYPPTAVIPDQEPAPPPAYDDAPPETPDPYDYVPEPEKKSRWPLIIGIVVAALCLLCICLAVVSYLGYNQGWLNF